MKVNKHTYTHTITNHTNNYHTTRLQSLSPVRDTDLYFPALNLPKFHIYSCCWRAVLLVSSGY